jgi:uncharacterized membrane protein YgcG
MKNSIRFGKLTGLLLLIGSLLGTAANVSAQSADPQTKVDQSGETAPDPWPRTIKAQGMDLMVYQPQLESWDGVLLQARAAVAVTPLGSDQQTFGVIWLTTETQVDKEEGLVYLDGMKITRGEFPKFEDQGKSVVAILQKNLPTETKVISLGRLEANLAVAEAVKSGKAQPVENNPPRIIFSTSPSILVTIDGQPALRQVNNTTLMRVINTSALIFMDQLTGKYYLHLLKKWMQADRIDGTWTVSKNPPSIMNDYVDQFAKSGEADLLNGDENTKLTADQVKVFISNTPAELIQTQGTPDFAPIDGTKLLYVKNTSSQIFMNTADQYYYVLISGRWFRAGSLGSGNWAYVPYDKLPADFAKIPENHPSGAVLMSVPGTEEAREAAIANNIPQTAEIRRDQASLDVNYDGEPQFTGIEDTSMSYAVNTATPVIRVSPTSYYAVDKGVWFTASAAMGPWAVASSVPPVIYTIPVSSPMYYVTYVRVYRATPDYVYVGYTPGYYGTVVNPSGVVVYGTGYYYRPYVGRVWYGCPRTYGYGVGLSYGAATGFAFGFTAGYATGVWTHPRWGAENYWRRADINRVSFNHVNVYNRWGSNTIVRRSYTDIDRRYRDSGTRIVQPRNNNVFATRDGRVYRNTNTGWDRYDKGSWNRANVNPDWKNNYRSLSRESQARNLGDNRTRNYSYSRRTTSSGGFSGGVNRGGFRSDGGSFRGGGGGRRGR